MSFLEKCRFMANETITQIGFEGWGDFFNSLFKFGGLGKLFANVTFSGAVAVLVVWVEYAFGLPAPVYLAFVSLLVAEFITGVKASSAEGRKLESRRVGRMGAKILVYSVILFIMNMLRRNTGGAGESTETLQSFGIDSMLYAGVYWTVFHVIVLQLLRSVFENLHRMGYGETGILSGLLKVKFLRFLTAPPNEGDKKVRVGDNNATGGDSATNKANFSDTDASDSGGGDD